MLTPDAFKSTIFIHTSYISDLSTDGESCFIIFILNGVIDINKKIEQLLETTNICNKKIPESYL